ncbi:unnamed protein product [Ilex paraguariensis]|uniref:peroxidase n=1 Tax=Ilex paraguariensis TaxID=185542 RepID=A0ABC8SAC1_9AQUA
MASSSSSSSSSTSTSLLLFLILSVLLCSYVDVLRAYKYESAPLAEGLSWSHYDYKCPEVESIIRKHLKKVFEEDIGQAAGLLRLHFHDCFVQYQVILHLL